MYSRDDKIVELDIQKEYRSLLGIPEKAVCQVNKEGKIEKEGKVHGHKVISVFTHVFTV